MSGSEEEDFWHDGGVGDAVEHDADYDRDMSQRHYNRLMALHLTAGYREGTGEASDDAVVQAGFNSGFREGAALAFHRSLCRSLFTALEAHGQDKDQGSDLAASRERLELALQRWERQAVSDAVWGSEEQEVAERELSSYLHRAGMPEQLGKSARLAALNPFIEPTGTPTPAEEQT